VTINKGLKLIAQLAGIDKRLTFHVSRHTFADIARKKKLPVQVTSELLGHTSIAITQQYFGTGFDDDTLDAAIRSVIE
jgi:integrase